MNFAESAYLGPNEYDFNVLNRLPKELSVLLLRNNGLILYQGGFHLRGACVTPDWHSLGKVWAGDFALHKLFHKVEESDIPFAQDCFGNQFILRDDAVYRLISEEGRLVNLDTDLQTFFVRSQDDPENFLSLDLWFRFQKGGGRLPPGQLLNVYPPLCTQESTQGVSITPVPMFERIIFLSKLANFIASLPEGGSGEFKIRIKR